MSWIVDIRVHHAVQHNEQDSSPSAKKIGDDRRNDSVIVLREVQDAARVSVVVVGPVRDRSQRGAGAEVLRRVNSAISVMNPP